MTEQERNKERLRALLCLVDAGEIDQALDFYSRDYVDHYASEARAGTDAFESLGRAFRMFAAAFTNTRHAIEDIVAEGDRVTARISVESRHTGEIIGLPASGEWIRNESIVIYRFERGRIRERWCLERLSTRALLTAAVARATTTSRQPS
jgi:predicted ester cyclase